jgi:hypothetical protein
MVLPATAEIRLTVSLWSCDLIMYAKCTFVIAARTHVLSVANAWITVAGDVPTSNMCMNVCDQNSAWVEFCDRCTFTSLIVLAVLLLAKDFGTEIKLVRDISSRCWASSEVGEWECGSVEATPVSFLDRVSFDLHPDFGFSGGEIDGSVRLLRRERLSKVTLEGDCVIRGSFGENEAVGVRETIGEIGVSPILVGTVWVSDVFWPSEWECVVPSLEFAVALSAKKASIRYASNLWWMLVPCENSGDSGDTGDTGEIRVWEIERCCSRGSGVKIVEVVGYGE